MAVVTDTYPGGQPKLVATFADLAGADKLMEEEFHEDGVKRSEKNFRKNQLHGASRGWFPDGRMDFEIEYESGEQIRFSAWRSNGSRLEQSEWKAGRRHGKLTVWDADGNEYQSVWAFGKILAGTMVAEWHRIDAYRAAADSASIPEGRQRLTHEYKAGEVVRTTAWHPNGRPRIMTDFANGRAQGQLIEWYESGETKAIRAYRRGNLHGLSTTWHENGAKKSEGMWENGVPLKPPREWDEEGNLLSAPAAQPQISVFDLFRFQYKLPGEPWVAMDPARVNKEARLAFFKPNPNTYFMLIPEVLNSGADLSLDALIEIHVATLKSTLSQFRLLESKPLTHRGLAGHRLCYESKYGLVTYTYASWNILQGRFLYRLCAFVMNGSRDKLLADLDKLMEGFEVLDQPASQSADAAGRGAAFRSVEYGYSMNLTEGKWVMRPGKVNRADLTIAREDRDMGMFVVAAYFRDLDPAPEDIARVLFSQVNVTYPSTGIRRVGGQSRDGRTEMDFEHTADNALWYKSRVVKKGPFGYLLIGFTSLAESTRNRPAFAKVFSDVEWSMRPDEPPATILARLSDRQKSNNAAILNELGLAYYNAGKSERALAGFQLAHELDRDHQTIERNLIHLLIQLKRYDDAMALIQPALERLKQDADLLAYRAAIFSELGRDTEALRDYARLNADRPRDEGIVSEFAALLWRTGDRTASLGVLESFVARNDSLRAALLLARLLRLDKREKAAIRHLLNFQRRARALAEAGPDFSCELIEQYLAVDDISRAVELAVECVNRFPESPDASVALGRCEFRLKQYKKAQAAFERALALRPFDETAKAHLEHLAGLLGQGEHLILKTPIPPVTAVAGIRFRDVTSRPAQGEYVDGRLAYDLVKSRGIEFRKGEKWISTTRRIIRIAGPQGMTDFGEMVYTFDPLAEELFVNHLIVYNDRLETVAVGRVEDYYTIQPKQDGMATQEKEVHLPVPGLSPNCFIDLMVSRRVLDADTFPFESVLMTSTNPILENTFAVYGDVADLTYGCINMDSPAVSNDAIVFQVREPAVLNVESNLPFLSSFLPVAVVSGRASWTAEVRRYHAKIRDLCKPDAAVAQMAREISAGCTTPAAVTLSLARHVQRLLNYQAIEFGLRAQTPQPPGRTIGRRYGDCKDHAVLLHALLTAAGVESRLALVQTREAVRFDAPSLSQFNHMIVYATPDGLPLFLDCTDKFSYELFPVHLAGRPCLLVDDGDARFVTVPEADSHPNRLTCRRNASWLDTSRIRVEEEVTLDGPVKDATRAMLAQEEKSKWRDIMTEILVSSNPSVSVESFAADHVESSDTPLRFTYTYVLHEAFEQVSNQWVGSIPAQWENRFIRLEPLKKRRHPFQRIQPIEIQSAVTIDLTRDFVLKNDAVLNAQSAENPHVSWTYQGRADPGRLEWSASVRIPPARLEPADFDAYRKALDESARALTPKLILSPARSRKP